MDAGKGAPQKSFLARAAQHAATEQFKQDAAESPAQFFAFAPQKDYATDLRLPDRPHDRDIFVA